jgi:hypothetical protein
VHRNLDCGARRGEADGRRSSALSRWPKPTVGRGWIAGERWWLHEVLEDRSHGWIGVLEIVSLVTLVAISAMAWLGVLAVLLESVA